MQGYASKLVVTCPLNGWTFLWLRHCNPLVSLDNSRYCCVFVVTTDHRDGLVHKRLGWVIRGNKQVNKTSRRPETCILMSTYFPALILSFFLGLYRQIKVVEFVNCRKLCEDINGVKENSSSDSFRKKFSGSDIF